MNFIDLLNKKQKESVGTWYFVELKSTPEGLRVSQTCGPKLTHGLPAPEGNSWEPLIINLELFGLRSMAQLTKLDDSSINFSPDGRYILDGVVLMAVNRHNYMSIVSFHASDYTDFEKSAKTLSDIDLSKGPMIVYDGYLQPNSNPTYDNRLRVLLGRGTIFTIDENEVVKIPDVVIDGESGILSPNSYEVFTESGLSKLNPTNQTVTRLNYSGFRVLFVDDRAEYDDLEVIQANKQGEYDAEWLCNWAEEYGEVDHYVTLCLELQSGKTETVRLLVETANKVASLPTVTLGSSILKSEVKSVSIYGVRITRGDSHQTYIL